MEGNEQFDGVGPRADTVAAAAAKVPSLIQGMEAPVVGRERWEDLQRLRAAGQTISQIARTSGFDRKTVRTCLRKTEWAPYRRESSQEGLLAAHIAWLTERASQVNYSARTLYQELRASRGYAGGYDTVKNAVRPLRAEAAVASLTQRRFETARAK